MSADSDHIGHQQSMRRQYEDPADPSADGSRVHSKKHMHLSRDSDQVQQLPQRQVSEPEEEENSRGDGHASVPSRKSLPFPSFEQHYLSDEVRPTKNRMSVSNLISGGESGEPKPLNLTQSYPGDEKRVRTSLPASTSLPVRNRARSLLNSEVESSSGDYFSLQSSVLRRSDPGPSVTSTYSGSERRTQTFPSPLPRLSSTFPDERDKHRQVSDNQRKVELPAFPYPVFSSSALHSRMTESHTEKVSREADSKTAQTSTQEVPYQPLANEPKAKRPWTEQEDSLLRSLVEQLGQGLWAAIAAQIPGRSGKQVRERWLNHLSPNVTKRPWSIEEDEIIIESHKRFGNCWSRIAKLLDGRSDNSVKNRFYTTLRRRISTPRATGKRGPAAYAQGALPSKKKRKSPTLQQPSEQVEIVNRKYQQPRIWE